METILAVLGMGRLTVETILYRNYPAVQTDVMLGGGHPGHALSVDLTYAWLDPRVRCR